MVFEVGSTVETIKVEVCSACHPFYTGKQNLIDTAGRVERFAARLRKSQDLKDQSTEAKNSKNKAQTTEQKNKK